MLKNIYKLWPVIDSTKFLEGMTNKRKKEQLTFGSKVCNQLITDFSNIVAS
jgi:hypothetical protein